MNMLTKLMSFYLVDIFIIVLYAVIILGKFVLFY